ncbi:MAG: divalent-cation tolerance protein CutA [Acidobacteriota bacterium]
MPEHLLVITTIGSEEEAAKLGGALVERRLAACVNVTAPVRSFYTWKGRLEDESERMLFIKTRADRYADLEAAVRELHPYEVPELIAVPIERGASPYLAWIDEHVRP